MSLGVLSWSYAGGLLGAGTVPAVQATWGWVQTGRLVWNSGLTAYGGLIGGTLVAATVLSRRGRPVLPFLDAAAQPVALAYFVVRIGCFLAGCDYGKPTDLPLAITFPVGSYAFRDHVRSGLLDANATQSLGVHPTELYHSALGLLLYLALSLVPMNRPGARLVTLTVAYAVGRSILELFRGDASRGFVGPVTTSQLLAGGSVLLVVVALAVARRRASVRGEPV